ncbi:patatin-like phospholipase family protein [Roseivirga pacifica]|uniref:patatin-like phospholipase family protein n=1 Tax=Roseivirga pacifica TaxID=1267423 RepID=UPI002095A202|nr:patatin-like phospholipase family protein [Roseivirga pacifica]MCO6359243.1 patatin [Roseivirga pacifica]MCO6365121.1 patatin [Roseivirga pacifica]MCO6372149.1 patatin [Roseivirga pacifica]MCO6375740.1 patatin [Roseivirga pacifica]MCO6379527.1 patatin [Roseivirga pacifica]
MSKKIKILSIDGGGIRGIIPGTILNYIESEIQKRTNNPDSRLADHFDLVAGTSTGGILTCTYLMCDENGQSKYSAADALNIYLERGGDIFSLSFWRKLWTIFGIRRPKYSVDALESALHDYFGDTMTADLKRPCIITSYDIRDRKAVFFNKVDGVNNPVRNYKVKDVARATSAAPTYFKPARIKSAIDAPLVLVDGGVFANNPALCAYAEARTLNFGKQDTPGDIAFPSAEDMFVLSLGTGTEQEPYYYDKAKNWGMVSWIQPIIDIMMSGNSETVDYQLKQMFKAVKKQGSYHRIQPSLHNAKSQMDDVSPQNLNALHEAGLVYIANNEEKINKVIDQILAD